MKRFRSIFRNFLVQTWNSFAVNVNAIDRVNRKARIRTRDDPRNLSADVLVVVLGWDPLFSGIPSINDNAMVLRTMRSAYRINGEIQSALDKYHEHPDEPWRARVMNDGGS